jgi:hypothetical protein
MPPQQPRRPVRHPVLPRRRRQRRRHDAPMINRPRPARPNLVVQPGQPPLAIAIPPADHRRARHTDQLRDPRVRHPLRCQQDDPGPLRQPGPHTRRPRQRNQVLLVTLTQHQRSRRTIRHASSSQTHQP